MTVPQASIIVCTRNRAASLERALASLGRVATDGGLTCEIVVVDNGSVDDTAEVISQAKRWLPIPVRGLHEPAPGIARARNCGLAGARGEWIAFFDDDQLAGKRWLVELLAAARRHGCRCAGGRVTLRLPEGCRRALPPFCRVLLGATPGPHVARKYNHRFTPGAGNLLVHRSVFDDIGRFDEKFDRRGEDTDLFQRILAAGLDAWYAPAALVEHVIPTGRLTDASFLRTARMTAEGLAADERRACGPWLFPFVWGARLAQAAAVLWPRYLIARLRKDAEQALAARCRLTIARRYLGDGLRLMLGSVVSCQWSVDSGGLRPLPNRSLTTDN